jgi:hypothetical protein
VRCCKRDPPGALGDEGGILRRDLDPADDEQPTGFAHLDAEGMRGQDQRVDRGRRDARLGEHVGRPPDRARRRARVEVVGLEAGAVVGDPVLGEVVGADPLGAVDGADLAAARTPRRGVASAPRQGDT